MKRSKFAYNTLLSFFTFALLVSCGGDSSSSSSTGPQGEGSVTYRLTFNQTWNGTDFPTNFPSNPHFSPMIGATHNNNVIIWRPLDKVSTAGIEQMAETGGTSSLNSELESFKTNGTVHNIFKSSGPEDSPGTQTIEFKVDSNHSLVSAVSMLAPSPDWFIGIRDVDLYEGGKWLQSKSFDLKLYDAGTDGGLQFTSTDNNSDPAAKVIKLTDSAGSDTDFAAGVHRSSGNFLGTVKLELIP